MAVRWGHQRKATSRLISILVFHRYNDCLDENGDLLGDILMQIERNDTLRGTCSKRHLQSTTFINTFLYITLRMRVKMGLRGGRERGLINCLPLRRRAY